MSSWIPPTGWPSLSTTIVGTLPASVVLLESLPPLLRTISPTTATTTRAAPISAVLLFIFRSFHAQGARCKLVVPYERRATKRNRRRLFGTRPGAAAGAGHARRR